jgi:hypothetical protein
VQSPDLYELSQALPRGPQVHWSELPQSTPMLKRRKSLRRTAVNIRPVAAGITDSGQLPFFMKLMRES